MPYRDKATEAAYRRNRYGANRANRPFVGWDGEGYSAWTVDGKGRCHGNIHYYILFGNTDGIVRSGPNLGTEQCLDAILESASKRSQKINIAYAFDYDVNMILKDLDGRHLRILKERGICYWRGYRIEHRPHKWFQVSCKISSESRISCRIYDIFSFFATSFVDACKSYLGESRELDEIAKGKARRSVFSYADLETKIYPYWSIEGKFLVYLAERLRMGLNSAGIQISSWHGPGAVATAVFRQQKTKDHLDRNIPTEVGYAARIAYSSGRFEPFRGGYYEGQIWIADINSAYPYAMSQLPSLRNGKWRYVNESEALESLRRSQRMGIYRVRYTGRSRLSASMYGWPMPYFWRTRNNRIHYPCKVDGWYFAPEAWLGYRYDRENTRIDGAWIFEDDGSTPFEWVVELFDRRKSAGKASLAGKGLKLGLNSGYGKLAQRVGWDEEKREAPRYHQLEYAGTITATCRAMLYSGALGVAQKGGLVSFDTDGIISTTPFEKLPNGIGDGLGQWEIKQYTGILFFQNGVYWLRDSDGNWGQPKSRGIPREQLSIEAGLRALRTGNPLVAHQHQFIGYGTALRGRMASWRRWYDHERIFEFGGAGKRFHNPIFCTQCRNPKNSFDYGLHNFILSQPGGGVSSPHKLPWIDENEDEQSPFHLKRWEISDD